jgi:hypothetical protein
VACSARERKRLLPEVGARNGIFGARFRNDVCAKSVRIVEREVRGSAALKVRTQAQLRRAYFSEGSGVLQQGQVKRSSAISEPPALRHHAIARLPEKARWARLFV